MKLLDSEKREILKLIEADKPLPDKYRFLLFDDKREKIATKEVVDIFGNDTMKSIEVSA
jgi:hypothetical protein